MAIALHKVSISSTIYESRPNSFKLGGAVMLSPNGLRVLDSLGVYERIRYKGFNFDKSVFKDENGKTMDGVYYWGHEKLYGYQALRVYREVIINELLTMVHECGIPIKYEMKFSNIVSESEESVEFAFTDGSTAAAPLLIGADGIHSRVRRYMYPSIKPIYSGQIGITSSVARSKLRIPAGEDYMMPVTTVAKPGAFMTAPQDFEGSEFLIGRQHVFPERDREGWDKMLSEKQGLLELLREDATGWPDVVQSALENANEQEIGFWAFYFMPRLERWTSDQQKVIILGDAAHAIPPTAGQGVNQAFEDVYILASLLARLSPKITLPNAISFWQSYRQERVDKVLDLTRKMNAKRLPPAEQAKLPPGSIWKDESSTLGAGVQMKWLYEADVDQHVSSWLEQQRNL